MQAISFDSFESNGLEKVKFDLTEKLDSLNKCFKTALQPENNIYGVSEINKGNGLTEIIGRNDLGHIKKDYLIDGQPYLTREKVSGNEWKETLYDDNGTGYLSRIITNTYGKVKNIEAHLEPNKVIEKGNFTCEVDSNGRPSKNSMSHVSLRENSRNNKALKKDSSYLDGDHRGHIIADEFNGPNSYENIIPQDPRVNTKGAWRDMERLVEDYVKEGHDVDYEVKVNYDSNTNRPSSFEPKITVDGKVLELDKSMRKIYNDAESTTFDHLKTTVKEHVENTRTYLEPMAIKSHEAGLEAGKEAAIVTCAISTVENVTLFVQGDITAEEMVLDITKDTGTAAVIGYGTQFVSTTVSQVMSQSSHTMLQSLGGSCIPTAVISFGIDSYDSVMEYAQGNIDGSELAYDLGESASGVAGSMAGAALAGAALGSVVPGAGTVVGLGVGVVGGMVGYAVASGAYESAVEAGAETVDALADKAQEAASMTVEMAKAEIPDSVEDVKSALNNFASAHSLPFSV